MRLAREPNFSILIWSVGVAWASARTHRRKVFDLHHQRSAAAGEKELHLRIKHHLDVLNNDAGRPAVSPMHARYCSSSARDIADLKLCIERCHCPASIIAQRNGSTSERALDHQAPAFHI